MPFFNVKEKEGTAMKEMVLTKTALVTGTDALNYLEKVD